MTAATAFRAAVDRCLFGTEGATATASTHPRDTATTIDVLRILRHWRITDMVPLREAFNKWMASRSARAVPISDCLMRRDRLALIA